MAKVKHISDGTNTWDVGGGTEVFTSATDGMWDMRITVGSTSISGNMVIVNETAAQITSPNGDVTPYIAPAFALHIAQGDPVHITFIGTLPEDVISSIGISNTGLYTLNLTQAGAMKSEYFATFSEVTMGPSTMAETAAPAPIVYDRLKVVAPLKVTNDGTDDCLGADISVTKRLWLEYDTDAAEWKTYTYDRSAEVSFDDIHIGDIITITPYNAELPGNFRFIGSLKDADDYIYLQYAGAVKTSGVVMNDGGGGSTMEVLTITPNYVQWKGIYAQDQNFSSAGIYATSTVDEIAEKLRSLKNVVDINDDYADANYILFGYGPNGVIQNLNSSVYRIMYDDGSFAMIYYPEAGTIPDDITPGFTAGPTSTPPAGNWQPQVAYDSVFFYSGNTKCSKGLQYNGQGFYGTPASGTGVYYTSNTNYFIVFGHLNDKYMHLEA